jgi:hypothetical protein
LCGRTGGPKDYSITQLNHTTRQVLDTMTKKMTPNPIAGNKARTFVNVIKLIKETHNSGWRIGPRNQQ